MLSPSHEKKDLVIKRAIYEKNGVREYWIADPRELEVRVMFLDAGRLGEPLTLVESGTVESRVLPGLRIPVSEVFAD